jgi:two-component system cell cycle response regulator
MKVLIAEDDPVFRCLLKEILVSWGYDVVDARDGNEAFQALQAENAPRLAILDWVMPGMEGIEVCRKVREELKEPYTYIILLTANQREDYLVTGMEAGADDYIIKPFRHNELKVRLRAGRRIIELQNELIEAREIIREKSIRDSLTGLLNHEEILGVLGRELARRERDNGSVSIIMADLDHFKLVNDTYGHMAGDVVLRATSRIIQSMMRPYDSVGRYGGEEFLIILPECGGESAAAFAERVRLRIGSAAIDIPEGIIPVTVSSGVATRGKESGWDAISLIKAADKALYRAKADGRNRVNVAGY